MKTNTAFRRALISLSHPISIGAIFLLLFNDHVWRRAAPSWITGKIGDFAWLIFAPFLLAAILAWFMPKRAALVGRASLIITGLVFALVKTDPTIHARFAYLFNQLLGWVPATVLDPTDLLALPMLLIAWQIWRQATISFTFHSWRGWSMLSLGALATMANVGASEDLGVRCVVSDGSQLAAIAWNTNKYSRFLSDDGGLTWHQGQGTPGDSKCPHQVFIPAAAPLLISDPAKPSIQYRLSVGQSIERSEDGGQTWRQDFNLGGEEARIRAWDDLFDWPLGPFDAVVQTSTGHVIAAMGQEGVLVRTAAGVWQWVGVGPYAVTALNQVDRVMALLSEELRVALAFGLLTLATLLRIGQKVKSSGVFLFLAWATGVFLCFQFKPSPLNMRYLLSGVISPATYAIIIVALVLIIAQAGAAWQARRRALGLACVIAVAASIGFIAPFVLWTQGVIPFYGSAAGLAFATLAAIVIAGFYYLRHYLHTPIESTTEATKRGVNDSGGAA